MRTCKKCGAPAVFYMRQHRLGLCKTHYLEWFVEQTERSIRRYRMFRKDEKILVAVSGGKDSLAVWDVLWRLGYQADGLYIALGIDEGIGYSAQSQRLSEQFAAERGLKLHIVDIPAEYGLGVPELARRSRRGRGKPCSVCGLVKRHEMNRIAHDLGYDVLVTGHNLDDEVAVLFGNVLQWQMGYIVRQGPVLPAEPGLARKAKPLVRFYERETAAYALLRGIAYIYDECPFAEGAKSIFYKELLNRLEEKRPGAKLQFYLHFLKAKEEGWFRDPRREAGPVAVVLHRCESCGQPTTAPGKCAFCRLLERVGTQPSPSAASQKPV